MNEAIKLEAVNPCAECRDGGDCSVCHGEGQA
jgi:ferredoxin